MSYSLLVGLDSGLGLGLTTFPYCNGSLFKHSYKGVSLHMLIYEIYKSNLFIYLFICCCC